MDPITVIESRTVVLPRTHAPGTPTGATFRAPGYVLLTADGKAVFTGYLVTGAGGVTA